MNFQIGNVERNEEMFDECREYRLFYDGCLRDNNASTRLCKSFLKAVEACEFAHSHHLRFIEKFNLDPRAFHEHYLNSGLVSEPRRLRRNKSFEQKKS